MTRPRMDMIERVARAICRAHFARRPHVGACSQEERLDFQESAHWKTFAPAARDVILAMREPTRTMLARAGGDLSEDRFTGIGMALSAWEDMIDAAMSENA